MASFLLTGSTGPALLYKACRNSLDIHLGRRPAAAAVLLIDYLFGCCQESFLAALSFAQLCVSPGGVLQSATSRSVRDAASAAAGFAAVAFSASLAVRLLLLLLRDRLPRVCVAIGWRKDHCRSVSAASATAAFATTSEEPQLAAAVVQPAAASGAAASSALAPAVRPTQAANL